MADSEKQSDAGHIPKKTKTLNRLQTKAQASIPKRSPLRPNTETTAPQAQIQTRVHSNVRAKKGREIYCEIKVGIHLYWKQNA